jgi:hypothetical protein
MAIYPISTDAMRIGVNSKKARHLPGESAWLKSVEVFRFDC